MKKSKLIISLLSMFVTVPFLSACSGGIIARYTNKYIEFFAYDKSIGLYNLDMVTESSRFEIPGQEYMIDDDETGRYFLDLVWGHTSTSFSVSKARRYVNSHSCSVKRVVQSKINEMSIVEETKEIYYVNYKFVQPDDEFDITYLNIDNAKLYNTDGPDATIYHKYTLNDIGGSFKYLPDLVDKLGAYRFNDRFLGWGDEDGNPIDKTKLRKKLALKALWLSEAGDEIDLVYPNLNRKNDFSNQDCFDKHKNLKEGEKLVRFHFPINHKAWLDQFPTMIIKEGETIDLTSRNLVLAEDEVGKCTFNGWSLNCFHHRYDNINKFGVQDNIYSSDYTPINIVKYNDTPFYIDTIDVYGSIVFEYKDITMNIYNERGYVDYVDLRQITYFNYKDYIFPAAFEKADHIIIWEEGAAVSEYKEYTFTGVLFDVTGTHKLLEIDYFYVDIEEEPKFRVFLDNIYDKNEILNRVRYVSSFINPLNYVKYVVDSIYYQIGDQYYEIENTLSMSIEDCFEYDCLKVKIYDR